MYLNLCVCQCLCPGSPQTQHISFLQTWPGDILVTLVFSEYVHVLLNYRDFIFLCVGVHTHSSVCVCARVCLRAYAHEYIQAPLRGMLNDRLVCTDLPLMIY